MMRTYAWVLALAAFVLLEHGTLCLAADLNAKPAGGLANETYYQEICRDDPFDNLVTVPTAILLAGDSDRGCCVWKTDNPKCIYTNKAYCTRKAKQANIAFEFYKGAECKAIAACK